MGMNLGENPPRGPLFECTVQKLLEGFFATKWEDS